jgi:FkbM family methyltransferase
MNRLVKRRQRAAALQGFARECSGKLRHRRRAHIGFTSKTIAKIGIEVKGSQMPRDNWVKALGIDTDGTLFVDIDNGMRFYDLCLDQPLATAVSIHPEDLMQTGNRRLYYRFLATLKEIESVVIQGIYDGSSPLKSGDVVVDAGARIGTFAVKASAAVGDRGRVIAIEPEPKNFSCLKKNIEANQLLNVIPVQKMLWSEARPLDLYLSANDCSHSSLCDAFYGSTGESIRVDAETLDGILDTCGIESVDFIKMDIEGSEVAALKGMRRTLKPHVHLAIAAYHPIEGKLSHTLIIPQLEQSGFTVTFQDGIVKTFTIDD